MRAWATTVWAAFLLSGCGGGDGSSEATGGASGATVGAGGGSAAGASAGGTGATSGGATSGGASTSGAAGGSNGATGGTASGGAGDGGTGTGGTSDGGVGGTGTGGSGVDAGSGGTGNLGAGLTVSGNRILTPAGAPFHGRGANLHDTRSCNACTWQQPDVQGLNRWADELIDGWGANFIRFDLEAYPDDGGYRVQWKPVTEDPAYLADIGTAVRHMASKPGVYVMVTVFADPSIKDNNGDYDSEWPTAATIPVYQALAEELYDVPQVLFALTNEPHGPEQNNPELAQRYLDSIDAIRAVEASHGVSEHIVVVQAPQSWARYLDYFVQNPIARTNVAYEIHVYNPESDFDGMITQPAQTLPILIGEYGPSQYMSDADVQALWTLAQSLEIPHVAWNFHMRCAPDMLQDTASDGCGLNASTGYDFPRTAWGDLFHDYLATPW
jgi:hypothetical protein